MNFNDFIKLSKAEYRNLINDEAPVVLIGAATCGNSAGARTIKKVMVEELEKNNCECKVIQVGCIGLCYAEPIITIIKKGNPAIFYRQITPEIATELVNSYILGSDPLLEYALGLVDINFFEGEEVRSDEEYPLVLTTGRIIYHYHSSTMTAADKCMKMLYDHDPVEINPKDAEKLDLEEGEMVCVRSRRGKIEAPVKITERSPEGLVFMAFHSPKTKTNLITNAAHDPVTKTPEFKYCAVRVEKI